MKILAATLLSVMTLFAAVPAAYAQGNATTIKIAVININAIRQSSTAVRSIAKQIDKYRSEFQAEITKQEEALRQANQELSRQRTLLAADAFAKKRREFEQRVSKVQRLVQQRKSNLEKIRVESMGKVQEALNRIVNGIAKKKGYNLILRRQQTIMASKSLDITGQVLVALNKNLPDVTVTKPAK